MKISIIYKVILSVLFLLFLLSDVISFPSYATYYGARAYTTTGYSGANCTGYALGSTSYSSTFNLTSSTNLQTWNACSTGTELSSVVRYHINSCIISSPSYGSYMTKKSGHSYTPASSAYKVSFRIAYYDIDNNGTVNIDPNQNSGDLLAFHFMWEDSTGKWCEKRGTSGTPKRVDGSNNQNDVNPYNLTWLILYPPTTKTCNYAGYHYERKDWH